MPRTLTILMLSAAVTLTACSADGPRRKPERGAGAVTLIEYRCDSGARIQASYPSDRVAVVSYRGRTHEMTRARSASGVRYVDDALQWWTEGAGAGAKATLSARSAGGDADERLEHCRERGAGE